MSLPRTIQTKITDDAFDTPILLLGRVGENLATRVVINASEWYATGGDYQLIVKRADSEIFTATISVLSDVITWTIPAAEIGAAGYGEIELNYLTDGIKEKSARCDTRVFSSIEIDSLPPSGTTWSQLVLASVGDARSASTDAEGSAQSASADADAAESAHQGAVAAQQAAETAQAASESAQSDAKGSASTATQAATAAGNSASAAAGSASAAHDAAQQVGQEAADILDPLKNATIRNTTETAAFDDEGRIVSIVHTDNGTEAVVRTDVFTYAGETIKEVRTLPNGSNQTNVYDMRNLVFQFNV